METNEFKHSLSYIIMMGVLGLSLTPVFFIGIIFLLLIPGLIRTKIIVGEKSLTIESGFFVRSSEDISYKKINNVVSERSFGGKDGAIKIYTGNSKPVQYTMISNVEVLKNMINEKIEANH